MKQPTHVRAVQRAPDSPSFFNGTVANGCGPQVHPGRRDGALRRPQAAVAFLFGNRSGPQETHSRGREKEGRELPRPHERCVDRRPEAFWYRPHQAPPRRRAGAHRGVSPILDAGCCFRLREVPELLRPESVGIASGMLLSALHECGIATLTHTPSPMGFLAEILDRPAHEKAFLLIPIGYPVKGCQVPDIQRKGWDELATVHGPETAH